jgi:hypothetical protein
MTTASGQEQVAKPVAVDRLTHHEVEQAARLINGFGIIGSQIVFRNSMELYRRAYTLLQKIKQQDEQFLRRLDKLARSSNDESALRLIEDLATQPNDVAQCLSFARRCLAASAFLGHCIVTLCGRAEAKLATPEQAQSLH